MPTYRIPIYQEVLEKHYVEIWAKDADAAVDIVSLDIHEIAGQLEHWEFVEIQERWAEYPDEGPENEI